MQKTSKNYYPLAIALSIVAIIIACIHTIIVALDHPVEMDDFYLEKYQTVDHEITDIEKKQKEFYSKYKINLKDIKAQIGKNFDINLEIIDKKSNTKAKISKIKVLFTRPDTNKHNVIYDTIDLKNIKLDLPGRWQIKVLVDISSNIGFFEKEFFVEK